MNDLKKIGSYPDLCGLGVFAGDIPSFTCGSAALEPSPRYGYKPDNYHQLEALH